MISGRNVFVAGGTFTQQITLDGRKSSFDILKDSVAHSAFHNSAARFDPPKCHPNTRVAVLDKIMSWIKGTDSETRDQLIMWLTGAAGAGKSAIAQSFIELCLSTSQDLIIASFFFGRSDGSRNHGASFIATLVYQIYHSFPAVQGEILSAIDADPLILTKSLDHQFTELLSKPLSNSAYSSGSRRAVVIDGLDECLNRTVQQEILRIISSAITKFNLPILFLIASRPEHDINVSFGSQDMDGMFTRLYLDDIYHPDEDIRTYLVESFQKIRTNHPFRSQLPAVWPSHTTVEAIVQKSSGQFIYAATVIGFVQSIRHKPQDRLDIVMNLRPPQGNLPFAQLDALYMMILSSVEDIEGVLYALSTFSLNVSAGDPLDISRFMSLDHEELDVLFCDLGALVSIVTFNNSYKTLKILHASIHDFLLDPKRSKMYCIDINSYGPRLLADIITYIAPKTSENIPRCDEINCRATQVQNFFRKNIVFCEASSVIMDKVSCFPLMRVLDVLQQRTVNQGFFGVTTFLYFCLFPITRNMKLKYYEGELDAFFLSQMPSYHSNQNLTSFLCLACHSGKDKFVPSIRDNLGHTWKIYAQFHPFSAGDEKGDVLLLHQLEFNTVNFYKYPYQQYITSFIQDPSRSGSYAIGPDTYTKGTIFFMEKLQLYLEAPYVRRKLSEAYLSFQITSRNDIWELDGTDLTNYDDGTSDFVKPFLLLGYIAFYLPLCGESQALVCHCQQRNFPSQAVMELFPSRTAILRESMKDYVERVAKPR